MSRTFRALNAVSVTVGTRISDTPLSRLRLTLESPALESMIDLMVIPPASISPKQTIDEANNYMLVRGVRLLFVLVANRELAGLITATDVLRKKPLRMVQIKGMPHCDILVEDIYDTGPGNRGA